MLEGSSSPAKRIESRPGVVIRFAGDSGDGMQVTGLQFTTESALAGNDLATLPDFPAEIRAPAGTLAGVSAFQLNFAAEAVFTPGDDLDVLVAMNPAALRMNLDDLRPGGILMVDREAFNEANLRKAGYERNPLDDGSLDRWQLFAVDITKLTTASPQLLLPRHHVVAVPSADRAHRGLGRGQVQEEPEAGRGQPPGAARGAGVRRERRITGGVVRGQARRHPRRHLPQHHGQYGDGARARDRGPQGRPAHVPR
jgi:hypothetical protein